MGEIADDILNGDRCEICGVWIDEPPGDGYPRRCYDCEEEDDG